VAKISKEGWPIDKEQLKELIDTFTKLVNFYKENFNKQEGEIAERKSIIPIFFSKLYIGESKEEDALKLIYYFDELVRLIENRYKREGKYFTATYKKYFEEKDFLDLIKKYWNLNSEGKMRFMLNFYKNKKIFMLITSFGIGKYSPEERLQNAISIHEIFQALHSLTPFRGSTFMLKIKPEKDFIFSERKIKSGVWDLQYPGKENFVYFASGIDDVKEEVIKSIEYVEKGKPLFFALDSIYARLLRKYSKEKIINESDLSENAMDIKMLIEGFRSAYLKTSLFIKSLTIYTVRKNLRYVIVNLGDHNVDLVLNSKDRIIIVLYNDIDEERVKIVKEFLIKKGFSYDKNVIFKSLKEAEIDEVPYSLTSFKKFDTYENFLKGIFSTTKFLAYTYNLDLFVGEIELLYMMNCNDSEKIELLCETMRNVSVRALQEEKIFWGRNYYVNCAPTSWHHLQYFEATIISLIDKILPSPKVTERITSFFEKVLFEGKNCREAYKEILQEEIEFLKLMRKMKIPDISKIRERNIKELKRRGLDVPVEDFSS